MDHAVPRYYESPADVRGEPYRSATDTIEALRGGTKVSPKTAIDQIFRDAITLCRAATAVRIGGSTGSGRTRISAEDVSEVPLVSGTGQ